MGKGNYESISIGCYQQLGSLILHNYYYYFFFNLYSYLFISPYIYLGAEGATTMAARQQKDTDVVVERCRSRLKPLYLKRRSKIQFGSSTKSITDLDSLFVDLKLVNDGKIGVKCKKQPDSHLDLLHIKDNQGNLCTHVLLRGYAGSGKTTLINKLAHDWAHCNKHPETATTFERFRLVFVLDARRIVKESSLENAISEYLLPKKEVLNLLKHDIESFLFLIDGYDEVGSEGIEHMAKILDNPILSSSWVIMTTRPHMVDIFSQHCQSYHEYVHVNVSGFSEQNIRKYVKKFFQLQSPERDPLYHQDHVQSLLRRIAEVHILRSLSSYPILLLMICHLWLDKIEQEEQDLPENLTQLYREAIEYLNKHWWERCKRNKDTIVLELGRVAIKHLFRDELTFEAEQNTRCLEDACEIGLICKEEMNRHKTVYSFIHKTFHEFSAATYLASLADGGDMRFIEYVKEIDSVGQIDKMEYLLLFCCGLSEKTAAFILSHVILIKTQRRNLLPGHDGAVPGDRQWNLPLKLFIEAKKQLQVRDDMECMDRFEKEVCCKCRSVRELQVSKKVFNPYPFNISILLDFLRCLPSLKRLYLHAVVTEDLKQINDNHDNVSMVSVKCKYLEIKGLNLNGKSTARLNFMSLLCLLHHFPALKKLSLKYVEISSDINLNSASHSELEYCVLKSIKTLSVYHQPNIRCVIALMTFLPSVKKLTIVKVKLADTEWNEELSSRVFPKLQNFSISLELPPRCRGTSRSSKLDVFDIDILSYMPSIEKFMLSINCVTNGKILFDKWNLNLNLTHSYESMKVLIIDVGREICDNLEVNVNILANITKKMHVLDTLNIANVTVVGDVELSMGRLKNLKEFTWADSSVTRNNIIMIQKLILCMPSLECFGIDAPYKMTDCIQTLLNRMPKLTTLSIGRHQIAVEEFANTVASASVKNLTIVYRYSSSDKHITSDSDSDGDSDGYGDGDGDVDSDVEEHPKSLINFLCLMPSLDIFTLVVDSTLPSPFKNVDSNETVDTLVESMKEFQIQQEDSEYKSPFNNVKSSTIMYFLRCMPQLQTFECEGIEISSQLNKINVSKFTSLRACKLARCKVDGHTLIVFLASMPVLEVLTLDEVDIVGPIIGDLDHKVFELCEELQQCSDINEDMRMRIRDAAMILKDQRGVEQSSDSSSDSDSTPVNSDSDSTSDSNSIPVDSDSTSDSNSIPVDSDSTSVDSDSSAVDSDSTQVDADSH